MNKLQRFLTAAILYIVLFCLLYCIIPLIVMVFGGSFIEVVQHPAYGFFAVIVGNVFLGIIFGETIDEEFYFKK